MSICFKKHIKRAADMCYDSYYYSDDINADGWHILKRNSKSDIPIIPDDGGMTPHTLRENPSLMVTGVNIDVNSNENIEDELVRLSSKIENVEQNLNSETNE